MIGVMAEEDMEDAVVGEVVVSEAVEEDEGSEEDGSCISQRRMALTKDNIPKLYNVTKALLPSRAPPHPTTFAFIPKESHTQKEHNATHTPVT